MNEQEILVRGRPHKGKVIFYDNGTYTVFKEKNKGFIKVNPSKKLLAELLLTQYEIYTRPNEPIK